MSFKSAVNPNRRLTALSHRVDSVQVPGASKRLTRRTGMIACKYSPRVSLFGMCGPGVSLPPCVRIITIAMARAHACSSVSRSITRPVQLVTYSLLQRQRLRVLGRWSGLLPHVLQHRAVQRLLERCNPTLGHVYESGHQVPTCWVVPPFTSGFGVTSTCTRCIALL